MKNKILSGQFTEGKIPTVEISGERVKRRVFRDKTRDELYISHKGIKYFLSDFRCHSESQRKNARL